MKTLKTTFASEAGYFLHLAIATVLAILAAGHVLAWAFWGAEMLFLWTRLRRLFFAALFLSGAMWLSLALQNVNAGPIDSTVYAGQVVDTGIDDFVLKCEGKRWMIYGDAPLPVQPGDEVEIRGTPFTPSGYQMPHAFDYGTYLASEGLSGALFAEEITVTGHRFHLNQWKNAVLSYLQATFTGEAGGMIIYVLLGNNDYLPPETADSIEDLGISHLFAISGMNIAMMVVFLERLLKTLYLRRGLREGVIGTLLLGYVLVTGIQISVLRAVLMVLCIYLKEAKKWPFSRLDLMSFLLIGFLLVRPMALSGLGFQLSFLVAFAILIGREVLNKGQGELRGILKIGCYAHLVALPILLEVNHSFNLLSIPANVFFVLFVERILFPLTFLTVFVPPFFPLYRFITDLFQTGVSALGAWDTSIYFNFSNDGSKALYFLLIIVLLMRVEMQKKVARVLGAMIFLCWVEWSVASLPGIAFVKMMDVGQGDAIYVRSGSTHVLIDTGNPDDYDTLIGFFRGENIRSLDAVFLTHDHADHVGEIRDLIGALDVRCLLSGSDWPSLEDLPITVVKEDEEVRVGTLVFQILASQPDAADENDRSLVLSARIGCHDWIFSGDAGTAVETAILEKFPFEADMVKVGHHGSSTASSWAWVQACSPVAAVISVAEVNRYGLPDSAVVGRWESTGAEVLRTDRLGTLTFWYFPWGDQCLVIGDLGEGFFRHELTRMIGFF